MLEQSDDSYPGQVLWEPGFVLDEESLAAFITLEEEPGEWGEEAPLGTGFFDQSNRPQVSFAAKELARAICSDAALVIKALSPGLAQRLGHEHILNTKENAHDVM
jgi:hypothetical protein